MADSYIMQLNKSVFVLLMTPGLGKDIRAMYDHNGILFLNLQNTISYIRPLLQSGLSAWWLHMVTLIFLRGLCEYVPVNILTLSP